MSLCGLRTAHRPPVEAGGENMANSKAWVERKSCDVTRSAMVA